MEPYETGSGVAVLEAPVKEDYGEVTRRKARPLTTDLLREMGKGVERREIKYRQDSWE